MAYVSRANRSVIQQVLLAAIYSECLCLCAAAPHWWPHMANTFVATYLFAWFTAGFYLATSGVLICFIRTFARSMSGIHLGCTWCLQYGFHTTRHSKDGRQLSSRHFGMCNQCQQHLVFLTKRLSCLHCAYGIQHS